MIKIIKQFFFLKIILSTLFLILITISFKFFLENFHLSKLELIYKINLSNNDGFDLLLSFRCAEEIEDKINPKLKKFNNKKFYIEANNFESDIVFNINHYGKFEEEFYINEINHILSNIEIVDCMRKHIYTKNRFFFIEDNYFYPFLINDFNEKILIFNQNLKDNLNKLNLKTNNSFESKKFLDVVNKYLIQINILFFIYSFLIVNYFHLMYILNKS